MTYVYVEGALPPNEGDNLPVGIYWTQSWGCPALHYEERIPPVVVCNEDWYAMWPDETWPEVADGTP